MYITRGLVRQDDSRFGDQGSGDGHPLLLTAGQMAGIIFELALQFQKLYDLLQKLCVLRPAVQTYGQYNIFIGREVGDQIVVLKDKADPLSAEHGELFPAHLLQVLILHGHAAGCGAVQSSQHIEQCGFTAARCADDSCKLPAFHRYVHIVQSFYKAFSLAIILFQVCCF